MTTPGGNFEMRHCPSTRAISIAASKVSEPAWYSPPEASIPAVAERIVNCAVSEVRGPDRVSIRSATTVRAPSSQVPDASSVRNWRAAWCRLAETALASKKSSNKRSGSRPGSGAGALVGTAPAVKVPMAWGLDDSGRLAHPPTRATTSAHIASTRVLRRNEKVTSQAPTRMSSARMSWGRLSRESVVLVRISWCWA